MTSCKPGDVVLVPFPFADLSTSKQRPALVLVAVESSTLPSLLIVAMITSQIDSENIAGDILVKDWSKCGLLYPSKLRLAKLVSIESKLVLKKLGAMNTAEMKLIRKQLEQLFFT